MSDRGRSHDPLVEELERMRERVKELEAVDAERKKAEHALRQSEERFRALIESSFDFTIILNAQGNITYISPNIADMWGREAEHLLGQDMYRYIHPDDIRAISDNFVRLLKRPQEPMHMEIRAQHADGTWRILEVVAHNQIKNPAVGGIVANFRDVTDRKKAEDALQKSEQKYRSLVENAGEVIFSLDTQGTITYISPIIERLSGYTSSEVTGTKFTQYIAKEDIAGLLASMERTLSGKGEPYEFRVLCKDGDIRHVTSSSSVILEYDEPVGVMGVITDITMRKKAEQALLASEIKYRNLFNNAQAGLFRTRISDGKLLDCNEKFVEITGFGSKEELITRGISSEQYANPADRERIFKEMKEKGFVRDVEVETIRDDGSHNWVNYSAYIYPKSGYIEGVIIDITDKKKAEVALRDSSQQWQTTFDAASDAICLLDPDQRILRCNRAMVEMFNVNEKEIIGKHCWEVVHGTAEPIPGCPITQIRRSLKREEMELHRGDRWFNVAADPILDENQEIKGIVHVVRDITENKKAEEELQRREHYFRSLIENSADGIMVMNRDGTTLYESPGCLRLVGYTAEERVGHSVFELIHPDDIKAAGDILGKVLSGLPAHAELRARHKDGYWITIEVNLSNMLDDPDIGGIIINMRDITERRQAEQKYSMLVENATDGVTIIQDKVIKFANKRMSEMSGYSIGELTGMSTFDLVPKDFFPILQERFSRREQNQAVADTFYTKMLCKDGTVKEMENSTKLIQFEDKPAVISIIRDVTERKRAEERLRDSEEKLRILFQTVGVGITVTDMSGKITDVNEELLKLTGFDRKEEVIGRNGFDFISEKDRDRAAQALANNLASGLGVPIELTLLRKDGSEYLADTDTTVMQDANGNPVALIIAHRDITERRKAEEALRESEEKYRLLADNASDVIMLMDMNAKPVYFSPSVTRLLGYSAEEALAGSMEDRITPASMEKAVKHFMVGLDREKREPGGSRGQKLELEMIHNNGSIVVVEMMVSFIRDTSGKPTGIMGVMRDITVRKQAEGALIASEEKYRTLVENIHDAIFIIKGAKIRYANEGFARITDYSTEELIGKGIDELVAPEDLSMVADRYMRRMKGEQVPAEYEFRLVKKDGITRVDVSMSVGVFTFEGGPAAIGVGKDITERKRAETTILQLSNALKATIDPVLILDMKGNVVNSNDAARKLFERDEFNVNALEAVAPEDKEKVAVILQDLLLRGKPSVAQFNIVTGSGRRVPLEASGNVMLDANGKPVGIVVVERDLTERRQAESRQKLAAEILGILNEPIALPDAINHILVAIKQATGFYAVGIRLRKDEDFPYFVQSGFSDDFLLKENTLVVRDQNGGICRDKDGNISLECTCGLVLSGKTDPSNPLFTPGGSAWTNDSPVLLDVPLDQDPRLHPRNRCIHAGFQSVALMPIRSGNEIVGLLQLNDRRKGCFTPEMIRFFEGIAASIGVALMRKQTEDALKESEEKFRDLAEQSPNMIFINVKGRVVYANRLCEEITGYTRDEFYSPNFDFRSLTPPEYRGMVEEKFQEYLHGRDVAPYDYTVMTKDGRRLDTILSTRFINYGGEKAILGTITDITERKRIEAALHESESKMRSLFEVSPDIIMNIDCEGKILFINRAMTRSIEEAIGTPVYDYIPTEYQSLYAETVGNVFRTGKPDRIETKGLGPGRRISWYEARFVAMKSDDEIESLMVVATDITQRKQAEEARKESEEKFRTAFDNANTGMCLVSLSGNLIKVNDKMSEIFGYSVEELERLTVNSITHPADQDVSPRFMEKALGGQVKGSTFEKRFLTKEGRMVWGLVSSALVHGADGEPLYFISQVQDITEQKKAQQALRESEERLRVTLEVTQIGVWEWNVKDDTWYASPTYYTMLGYEPVIGPSDRKVWLKRGHPDDVEMVTNKIKDVLNGVSDNYSYEARIKHADGSYRWNSVVGHVVEADANGKPIRLAGVRIDITERKRAEEALRASEEKHRMIADLSQDIICTMGFDGVTTYASPAVEKILGYKPDELIGRNVFDFVAERSKKELVDRFMNVLDLSVQVPTVEVEEIRKDGARVFIEYSNSIIKDGEKPIGVLAIGRDITEQKRAQEALKASEIKYRDLFEHTLLGMEVIDGTTGKIVLANHSMARMFGFKSPEDMVGIDAIKEHVLQEDLNWVLQMFSQSLADPTRHEIATLRAKTVDGRIIWVTGSATSYIYEGKLAVLISLIDVTAVKEAEYKLKETEERIKSIVTTSQEWIWAIDSKGNHTYSNPAIEDILGYSPAELIGRSANDLLHEDDVPLVRQVMARCVELKAGWSSLVLRWKHRGGGYRYLESSAVPILDISGNLIGFQGSDRDITVRKQAEQQLRETRDYMENLIEHANVPMVVWTPDFRITRFNRAFERLTGMKAKSVIGKDLEILFPKGTRDRSMSFIRTAMQGARWEVVEIPIVNVDGDVRTVLWNISPIYAEDGKTPMAIIAQGQDITERKKAEEALRESEEMARSMLDNAAMGIYLLQDKKFLYVNPTFEKIIGYKSEELVGKEALNYVHLNDRGIVRIRAIENLKGISTQPYEFRALRKDGQQIWVMERVTSIRYKGRRAIIASFMETTEHKKSEEKLEQAYEELKTAHDRMVQSEKLRAMGEMASGIAHDFNNMLAVILGRTQLAIDDVKDDKVRKDIQIIEQAALDAAKTVKRLQDFARIRVEHPFELLDVNEIIEGVLKMVETRRVEMEQTKSIGIKVEHVLGKVGHVSGDAAELREALLNILFNALDAMPTGGKLTVKSEQDEDWVQISIKDTGVGIPDKVKSKIFQPFFTTKASKGSGLGLSVTYGIIARHGGMIKFDSEVGKGTMFSIKLPLAAEAAKQEAKKRKTAAAKPANILTVDDESEVLKALDLTLEYFGHWVKGVTSGADAVKAFKDGNYDLVITDLGMPGMSGWDVARAIKKIKPDIPVLLITGWVIDLDEEQKTLVDGVIAKPFSRDSISSAVSQVFSVKKKRVVKKRAVKKSTKKKSN